jgi:ketosteroid isomerase-like protein
MNKSPSDTLSAYLAACEARDPDKISAHFCEDARVIDPLGDYKGIDAIRAYFTTIYADLTELVFETGPISWCANSCAVTWAGKARRADGSTATYSGIDVFSFGENQLISQLWAFWTPEQLLSSDNVGQI